MGEKQKRAERRVFIDGLAEREKSSQLAESIQSTLEQLQLQLQLQNQPTRMLLAVDNGRIVEARQAIPQTA